ncbi:MAG: T9SS type A sorting domain-containing protein [Bacteroidota bacterium]
MKKLLLVAVGLFTAFASQAQTIINNSFEQWTGYAGSTTFGIPFTGQNPNGWSTSDSLSQTYSGGSSAFPGNDPQDGSKSIHLKSTQITAIIQGFPFQITVPGIATNGTLTGDFTSLSTAQIKFIGGTPDTARSSKMLGYLKYVPAAAIDQAYITVIKLKYNSVTGQRDTIAKGEVTFGDTIAAFQPFEVILNYRDFLNKPDTSLIILKSGFLPETVVFTNPDVTIGSELTIDQLSFTGFVSVDEAPSINDFSVFPSPASDVLNITAEINGRSDWRLVVLDLSGRQIVSGEFNPSGNRIDISSWPIGNYLLQLLDEKGAVAATRQFSVVR